MSTDTIYAVSTAVGRAAIAIVRASGSGSEELLRLMCRGEFESHRARLSGIHHPVTGELLDRGLVIWFAEGHSFTGEPMIELHVHGGRAVVRSILAALGALTGFRPAGPGEFTRRAFENGRLDLTSVEGLADLIEADTEMQRRQALRASEGGLWRLGLRWREELLDRKSTRLNSSH